VSDNPELEIKGGTLEPGDVFVICSDGLTAHVEDEGNIALASERGPNELRSLIALRSIAAPSIMSPS
jgi:serine/threonine protein phosphatase PrpC